MRSFWPALLGILLLATGLLHLPVLAGGGVRLALDQRMFAPWNRCLPAGTRVPDLQTGIYNRLSSDSNFWYAGQMRMTASALHEGEWPGWDRNTLGGTPLAAQGAVSPWYPPYLLLLLGDPLYMSGWLALLHMVLAGLFTARLLLHLGADRRAAVVGALAFALCPWLTLRSNNMSLLAGAAWIPLLLDAGLCLGRGRKVALHTLLLGLACALTLAAGMPQYAFIGLWGAGALLVPGLIRNRANWPRIVGGYGGGCLLGLALAAPALLPLLRLLGESVRSAISLKLGLAPGALWGLLTPEFFGGAADLAGWSGVHDFPTARALLTDHAQDNLVENCLYLGAPMLLLALVGFRRRLRLPQGEGPGQLYLLGLALVTLGLALRVLPWASLYRLPGLGPDDPRRLLVLFHLALICAGTLTLSTLFASPGKRGLSWALTGVPLVLLFFGGWVLTGPAETVLHALCGPLADNEGVRLLAWERFALLTPALTLAATGGLILLTGRARALAWVGLLLLVGGENLRFAWRSNPAPSADQFATTSRTIDKVRELVTDAGPEGPPRLLHVQCYHALQGNLLAPMGVPVISATHPLPLDRVTARLRLVEKELLDPALPRGISWLRNPASVKHPLLASGRIGLFCCTTEAVARQLLSQGLELVYPRPGEPEEGVALLRAPWVNPRAKIHYRWHRVADAAAAAERLAREPHLPVVESSRTLPPAHTPVQPAAITWVSSADGRVELKVNMEEGRGLLVLADNYYPGWRVQVDGKGRTLLPADLAFMGVCLDPGEHRVVFSYTDPDRNLAFCLLLAGLAGAAFLLFLLRRG